MPDKEEIKPTTIEEIAIALDEFHTKFNDLTSDPDNPVSFSKVEDLLSNLTLKTKDIYLKDLSNLIENLDEKAIVKKKKEN